MSSALRHTVHMSNIILVRMFRAINRDYHQFITVLTHRLSILTGTLGGGRAKEEVHVQNPADRPVDEARLRG